MKFWDSSAIVPLLVPEPASPLTEALFRDDSDQLVWCLTEVEVASGLARRHRERPQPDFYEGARQALGTLAASWQDVVSIDVVRSRALRLLRSHPLGAGDALQLAAALVACEERPETLPFVCLDDRLREAARREGFPVFP